jgi:hypothetical protein
MPLNFLKRLVGIVEKPKVIEAPQWLKDRMARIKQMPPPTAEQVETQMKASASLRRCLDRGMTQEEAKEFALDHAQDILAHQHAPWRKKIGENRYEGSCGCVFDSEGHRTQWCGDHY